jgi:hypothetical protein
MKSQRTSFSDSRRVAIAFATGIAIAFLAVLLTGLLLRHTQASISPLGRSEIVLLGSGIAGSYAALWMMRRKR